MTTKADFIAYKLQRAEESLKAAEILANNGLWLDALSKTYYAAFYAVSALLINLKLNPKTHQGAKSLFNKEFIMSGLIDEKFGKLYSNLMARRFEADYEVFALIDKEEVPDYIKHVQVLIDTAKEIIDKDINAES